MKVKLEKYDPEWKSLFEIEERKLHNALTQSVRHITIKANKHEVFVASKSKILTDCDSILGSKGIKIEHIGSTSIPDICSKPVINIMIGVEEEAQLDNNINKIISLGYTYVQKYEIYMPFRRYFFKLKNPDIQLPQIIGFNDPDIDKGNHEDNFHIHMVKINSDFWINQLLFRDYLRSNYQAKKEYEDIKIHLANMEWDRANDYAEAKSDCITKILE